MMRDKEVRIMSGRVFQRVAGLLVLASFVLGACGTTGGAPVETVVITEIVEGTPVVQVVTATPGEAAAAAQWLPRKETLQLMCCGGTFGGDGYYADAASMNPIGPSQVEFQWFVFEPLAFYNGLGGKEVLWLAESYEYSADYAQLTIKIRPGVEWSDGVPFTAADVAYTLTTLRDNAPALQNSTDVSKAVKDVEVVDDLTAVITFNQPEPRFFADILTYHYMMGIAIVPEHIYTDVEDIASFTNLDLAKGWPVGTSAYRVSESSPERKVFDLDKNWWAARTGFHELPQVPRIMIYPQSAEEKMLQLLVMDELDGLTGRTPTMIAQALEQNPKLSTYSGRKMPYGQLDFWPFGLSFNTSVPPFDNPDVRWALSYAINREQMIDVAYLGEGMVSAWNMPPFPGLEKYKAAIADLFVEYPTTEFDLAKSAELMEKAGYTKGSDGFWKNAQGEPLKFTIITFSWALDVTVPMVQQLRNAGFDADYSQNPEGYSMIMQGTADAYVFGHGASVTEPYAAMRMYHSRYSAPTGEMAAFSYRWSNAEYDALVDKMATLYPSPDDPEVIETLGGAMRIWLEALPDIPLVQNYHRNPHNETYWVNWPSEADGDVNDAWWHRTALLWVYELERSPENPPDS